PQTSCSTLGRLEFMRVDLPAARMIADSDMKFETRMTNDETNLNDRMFETVGFEFRHSSFVILAASAASYPAWIRTRTNRTKIYCATVTPRGKKRMAREKTYGRRVP